jgi:hypothetical protein
MAMLTRYSLANAISDAKAERTTDQKGNHYVWHVTRPLSKAANRRQFSHSKTWTNLGPTVSTECKSIERAAAGSRSRKWANRCCQNRDKCIGEPKASRRLVLHVSSSVEEPMLKKLALATATIGLLMSAASADYYIVQETATKKCKVVETKPTETTWVQVGPAAFKTQAEAQKQVKTVCVEKR